MKRLILSDTRRFFSEVEGQKIHALASAFRGAFLILSEVILMETRVALIGIVVEDPNSVDRLNSILHQYGTYIIGRMGLPYPKKAINIISIAVDAPSDIISTLSGKLGMLSGVSSKAVYAKYSNKNGGVGNKKAD